MDEIESTLLDCLSTVFPDLSPQALPTLDQDSHPEWDSIAHATLVATLAEAFEIELDFEAFAEATS